MVGFGVVIVVFVTVIFGAVIVRVAPGGSEIKVMNVEDGEDVETGVDVRNVVVMTVTGPPLNVVSHE